jgi:metal-responsive CopG/Arc/MetJ family transcriptional regulator
LGWPEYEEGGDVQVTLYCNDEDQYLLGLVDRLSERERKSRSAVIMSILEEHFERGKRLGEILVDMGALELGDVEEALVEQKAAKEPRMLGEILVKKGVVPDAAVKRALIVQGRFNRS